MLEVDIEKRLNDFTLRVVFKAQAQIVVLFGPSGAGKSMTLNCVAGLAHPDRGLIRLDERVFFKDDGKQRQELPLHQRRVGYVFQHYALFPHMTVAQNLAYGVKKQPDTASRVETMLTRLRLAGLGSRYPHQLSGGQQQRVALGRALMIKPRLLLLDEPFAALDQGMRENLQTDLLSLQRELGLTVIYITHNLMDAFAIGDCLAVMQTGHMEQIGPIRQVFHRPANRSVAEILGVRNLLEGVVQSAGAEGLVVNWAGHTILAPPMACAPGDRVSFYIRPEDIKILYPDRPLASTVQHNRFKGQIRHTQLAGSSITVQVGVEHTPVELESRLPLRVYQSLGLEVGADLTFSLRRDCVMLLPQ